jgi:hypothetical protein
MIDATLSVLVLGVCVIAVGVDLAALVGFLKAAMNRKEQP